MRILLAVVILAALIQPEDGLKLSRKALNIFKVRGGGRSGGQGGGMGGGNRKNKVDKLKKFLNNKLEAVSKSELDSSNARGMELLVNASTKLEAAQELIKKLLRNATDSSVVIDIWTVISDFNQAGNETEEQSKTFLSQFIRMNAFGVSPSLIFCTKGDLRCAGPRAKTAFKILAATLMAIKSRTVSAVRPCQFLNDFQRGIIAAAEKNVTSSLGFDLGTIAYFLSYSNQFQGFGSSGGSSRKRGASGESGQSGQSGQSGESGQSGQSGQSGESGQSGQSGESGSGSGMGSGFGSGSGSGNGAPVTREQAGYKRMLSMLKDLHYLKRRQERQMSVVVDALGEAFRNSTSVFRASEHIATFIADSLRAVYGGQRAGHATMRLTDADITNILKNQNLSAVEAGVNSHAACLRTEITNYLTGLQSLRTNPPTTLREVRESMVLTLASSMMIAEDILDVVLTLTYFQLGIDYSSLGSSSSSENYGSGSSGSGSYGLGSYGSGSYGSGSFGSGDSGSASGASSGGLSRELKMAQKKNAGATRELSEVDRRLLRNLLKELS